jgi:hypothetical protein
VDNFEARDTPEAAAFVKRSDVQVLNWYRPGKNMLGLGGIVSSANWQHKEPIL